MSTAKFDTLSNLAGTYTVPVATVAQGSAKAWVNFNGTGTVAIRASFNVSSMTDNGVGDYTMNFTTAMPDANYSLVVTSDYGAANNFLTSAPTTSAARVQTFATTTGGVQDRAWIGVAVFR